MKDNIKNNEITHFVQDPISTRACQFAEWLQENRWFSFLHGKWYYSFEHGTSLKKADYEKNYMKTTQELYVKFSLECDT